MKKPNSKIVDIEIKYFKDNSDPELGIYRGNVLDPKYRNEMELWIEEEELFDFDTDDFAKTGFYLIHVYGSRRSLFEFGKYLIGLSTYETKDPKHYNYLKGFGAKEGEKPCKIRIQLPPDLKPYRIPKVKKDTPDKG